METEVQVIGTVGSKVATFIFAIIVHLLDFLGSFETVH